MYLDASPYSYSVERLWYVLLIASVLLPFLIAHRLRFGWKFTLKSLLLHLVAIAGLLAWVRDDLPNLVLIDYVQSARLGFVVTPSGDVLRHPDCLYLFVALTFSSIFAWALYARWTENMEQESMRQMEDEL